MLDGKYNVSLNTPLGNINGSITLISNGNNVQGIIETMGMKNNFNGTKISNDMCKFTGSLNTPIGNITYNAMVSGEAARSAGSGGSSSIGGGGGFSGGGVGGGSR